MNRENPATHDVDDEEGDGVDDEEKLCVVLARVTED